MTRCYARRRAEQPGLLISWSASTPRGSNQIIRTARSNPVFIQARTTVGTEIGKRLGNRTQAVAQAVRAVAAALQTSGKATITIDG